MAAMSTISRRDFVRGGAALSAGVMAGLTCSASPAEALTVHEADITWDGLYDVIVVGFGAAACVAATSAADEGARVLVLEIAPEGLDGGNTRYTNGEPLYIEEGDIEGFETYISHHQGGYEYPTPEVRHAFAVGATQVKAWVEDHGGNFVQNPDGKCTYAEFGEGSETVKKWRIDGTVGMGVFHGFLKGCVEQRSDQIDVWYETAGKRLIQDEATGAVIGVVAQTADGQELRVRAANGVVLACGGYENNAQLMQALTGMEESYPTATHYNFGDGVLMALGAGAKLAHGNFTGYINSLFPDGEYAESESASVKAKTFKTSMMYVGADGTRFADESMKPRNGFVPWHGDFRRQQIAWPAWCVFDEKARTSTDFSKRYLTGACEEALENGDVVKGESLSELAETIGVDAEGLTAQVAQYNSFCEAGSDPAQGRDPETLVAFDEEGPFYAFRLVQSITWTQGGPWRNENAEVVDVEGNPIPHLYSAGELGSLFSKLYEGSGTLTDCFVSGWNAGRNAAAAKDDVVPAEDIAVEPYVPAVKEETYETGENQYIGVGEGLCGKFVVRVTMDGATISLVEILHSYETYNIVGKAVVGLSDELVGMAPEDVSGVEVVAGATMACTALLDAVSDALSKR